MPSRDEQVINEAVANATAIHLPQTIARAVFTAIINSSVPFELCVVSICIINSLNSKSNAITSAQFDSFHNRGHQK